jgi:hypothetical protein
VPLLTKEPDHARRLPITPSNGSRRKPKRIKPWPNVSWRCWMLASSKPWLPWRRPRPRAAVANHPIERRANVGIAEVQPGHLEVSLGLLSLVPAHGLWIDANFKENQLAHMRAGQAVTIVADV